MTTAEDLEVLICWVGGRVWKSRVTLGLVVSKFLPFSYFLDSKWHIFLTPTFSLQSAGAGDVSTRLEWFGVAVYLRVTL